MSGVYAGRVPARTAKELRASRRGRGAEPLLVVGAIMAAYGVLLYTSVGLIAKLFSEEFIGRFSSAKALEATMAVFGIALFVAFMGMNSARPSVAVLHLLNLFSFIPICVLYATWDAPRAYFLAVAGCFALLVVLTNCLPVIRVPVLSRQLFALLLLIGAATTAYVYGQLVLTGGLARLNFNLAQVYVAREAFVTQARFPLADYLVPWQGYVLTPAVFAYALYRRSLLLAACALAFQVLLFGMTSFKSTLFAPLLVGGLVVVGGRRWLPLYLYGGGIGIILIGQLGYHLFGDYMSPSLLIRRMFLIPAKLHFLYYDWFSHNPKVMLSNSIFRWFIDYPYDLPITRVISWAYFGRDFGPNVGYLGDAYAHFGVAGMIAFTVLLAFVLKVLDSLGSRVPSGLALGLTVLPAFSLVNSALLTVLLTHGFLASLLALWCFSSLFRSGAEGRPVLAHGRSPARRVARQAAARGPVEVQSLRG